MYIQNKKANVLFEFNDKKRIFLLSYFLFREKIRQIES
jgi:hypothetical protein